MRTNADCGILLWEACRAVLVRGYGYSQFCELYRRFKGCLPTTVRESHGVGERIFVDYAGRTIEIVDGLAHGIGKSSAH